MKTSIIIFFLFLCITSFGQRDSTKPKIANNPVFIESIEGNTLQPFKAAKIGMWYTEKKWVVSAFLGVGGVHQNEVMNPNYTPDLVYTPYAEIAFGHKFLKVFYLNFFVGANRYREYLGYGTTVKMGNHFMLGANHKQKEWDGVIYFRF